VLISSSPQHNSHLYLSVFLLIPLIFNTPANNHTVPCLTFCKYIKYIKFKSIYICMYTHTHTHTHAQNVSVYLSLFLSVCLSVRPPACPSVPPSVSPSVPPYVRPSAYLHVCVCVCVYIYSYPSCCSFLVIVFSSSLLTFVLQYSVCLSVSLLLHFTALVITSAFHCTCHLSSQVTAVAS